MTFVLFAVATAAVAAYVTALINAVRMFRMRSDRVSAAWLLLNGFQWFNADNFKPEAARPRRLLMRSFLFFIVCLFCLAIVVGTVLDRP